MAGSGAGDVTIFTDAFTRANEAPISTNNWVSDPGAASFWGAVNLTSNAVRPTSASSNAAAVNTTALNANQYAKVQITAHTANTQAAGVLGRTASAADVDGYGVQTDYNTTTYSLVRYDDTGAGLIVTGLATFGTVAVNDVIEYRGIGTLHAAVQNGTYIGAALDATYAVGIGGVYVYAETSTANSQVDNFEAGNITPTRFYFPSAGSTVVSPTFDAGWEDTEDAVRRPLSVTRTNTTAADLVIDEAVATNPVDVLGAQYIFPTPLTAGQTIKGVVRGIIRCHESNALGNFSAQWRWKVWKADATLAADLTSFYAGAAAEEPSTTTINRRFPVAFTQANVIMTPYTVPSDTQYYLGCEIGCRGFQADATNYTWTMALGDPTAGSDCAEDITGTTGVAWAEFDSTISFTESTPPNPIRMHDSIMVGRVYG